MLSTRCLFIALSHLFLTVVLIAEEPVKLVTIPQQKWAGGGIPPQRPRMKEHTDGKITSIVLHHTESPNESPSMEKARLRGVQRYHIEEKEWGDIAYHYLIGASGRIYEGRAWKFQGDSGTEYDLNGRLLICVLGNFTKRMPEEPAMAALLRIVAAKLHEHDLRPGDVVTHRMVASTDCPGDTLQNWYDEKGKSGIAEAFAKATPARDPE